MLHRIAKTTPSENEFSDMKYVLLCLLLGAMLSQVVAGTGQEAVPPKPSEGRLGDGMAELSEEDALAITLMISREDYEEQCDAVQALRDTLAEHGLVDVDVAGDGDCQFSAICLAAGLTMDAEELRNNIVLHMADNADRFSGFHDGDWGAYLQTMSTPGKWGDHVTLAAAAEYLQRPIMVYIANADPLTIPALGSPAGAAHITLAFQQELHYQAAVAGQASASAGQWNSAENCDFPSMCSEHWSCFKCQAANEPADAQALNEPSSSKAGQGAGAKNDKLSAESNSNGGQRAGDYKKRQGERGSSFKDPWSPFYSYKPEGGKAEALKGKLFRSLKQESFPTICALSEDESKQLLRTYGFLPPRPPDFQRTCRKCNSAMELRTWASEGEILKCKKQGENAKCEYRIPCDTAYTPMHNAEVSFNQYLRLVYCFSMQERIDKAVHYCEIEEDKTSRFFNAFVM